MTEDAYLPDEDHDNDFISKTQRKKEAQTQQELGERLAQLSEARLEELPLSDRLLAAIAEYKRLPNKYGAIKRQLQFIGKLMRDHDIEEISSLLEQAEQGLSSNQDTNEDEQRINTWCELVLEQGDQGIQRVIEQAPMLERQQLRQQARNFTTAKDDKGRTTAQQKLRDYLRENS